MVPEPEGFGGLTERIAHEIAGGWSAFNRDDPRPDPPHALLIVREHTDDPAPHEVAQRLSNKFERFLLLARLFSAGTVYSVFEVRGMTTLVSRINHTRRSSAAHARSSLAPSGSTSNTQRHSRRSAH